MISLLVVNYRSSALAADAIRSARATSASELQVVVVDNSCDPDEAAALQSHGDVLIVAGANLGYAGAINAGRKACEGDVIVICNPDVVFAGGCIDELAATVRGGTSIAGPALFWDSAHEWHLPPGDLMTGAQKLSEVIASRSPSWAKIRDRRRVLARLRFWSASKPLSVNMLSGAVMAVSARDFDELGGFDERFRLYFEETDFLRRAGEARKHIACVPAARCRHLFNQSAAQDGARAASLYAESERRYLEKWNGPLVARLLKRFERAARVEPAVELTSGSPVEIAEDGVAVEASPLASFATAAGRFADRGEVRIPHEVIDAYRSPALYVRVVRRSGEVLATYVQRRTD